MDINETKTENNFQAPTPSWQNPPTPPSKTPAKTIAGIIFVLVLVAVGVLAYKLVTKNRQASNNQNTQTTSTPPIVAQQKTVTEKYSKLTIPNIVSSSEVSASSLPEDLQIFILSGVKNVKTNSVIFTNSQTGYSIDYQATSTIFDLKNQILAINQRDPVAKAPEFRLVAGSNTNNVAFIEKQSSQYQVRTNLEAIRTGGTKVNVIILKYADK